MAKEYSKMTPAERLQDRIAKNRQIDERLLNPQGNWTLEAIVVRLNKHHQRASYKAVADILGVLARGVMGGRQKSHMYSWVVAASGSQRGWPTDYTLDQIHPECLAQIRKGSADIIEDAQQLRTWLNKKCN